MSSKSARVQSDFKLILKITLVWMFLGLIIMLYDYITTSDSVYYLRTEDYNFFAHMASMVFGGFLGGVIGASFLVLFATKQLRNQPLYIFILVNSIAILFLIFIIDFIVIDVVWSQLNNKSVFEKEALEYTLITVFSISTIRSMAIWFAVALGTAFVLRMSEGFGPGILLDIIRGKYHKPIEEERIFMFLDIKSSTALAEKLGHNKYFQLLNEFFADITDAIKYSKGEIYQYVGDEVVVSWRVRNGIKNNNCLNCFFEAKKEIENQSSNYLHNYGVVPEFKAGLHIGFATVGEIELRGKQEKTRLFAIEENRGRQYE